MDASPIEEWGPHAAAAVVRPDGIAAEHGPAEHVFRWASVTKLATALAVLVAVEEGVVELEDAAGPEGATVRHLLAHASGLPFEDGPPIARPGQRRIYSNQGFEALAAHVAANAEMPFEQYLAEAVLRPLGLGAELRGSPAADVHGTLRDAAALAHELLAPTLVAEETLAEATTVVFPGLAGVLPDRPLRPARLGPRVRAQGREAEALDRGARLGAHVRTLRRRRNLPLGRPGARARARRAHRPRVRRLGAGRAARALGRGPQPRNSSRSRLSSSGRSRLGRWPAPATVSSRALGISAASRSAARLDVLDVLGADDDERGSGDRPQPLDRLGLGPRPRLIVQGQLQLVRAQRHRLGQLAHLRRRLRAEPQLCLLLRCAREVARCEQRLLRREARLGRLRPLPAADARADEHEALDELRPGEHQLERDAAAEGAADDGDRSVEQRRDVVDVGDRPRLQRRVAVAREVGCDDAVAGGPERFDLRCPHPPVGDARVEEEDVHSSTNSGRSSSSKVARSQLATTAGVTARTDAVRGIRIASATSPNQSPRRRRRRSPRPSWLTFRIPERTM